jgi:hypothetical protein
VPGEVLPGRSLGSFAILFVAAFSGTLAVSGRDTDHFFYFIFCGRERTLVGRDTFEEFWVGYPQGVEVLLDFFSVFLTLRSQISSFGNSLGFLLPV